jgi:hypothetical protein
MVVLQSAMGGKANILCSYGPILTSLNLVSCPRCSLQIPTALDAAGGVAPSLNIPRYSIMWCIESIAETARAVIEFLEGIRSRTGAWNVAALGFERSDGGGIDGRCGED